MKNLIKRPEILYEDDVNFHILPQVTQLKYYFSVKCNCFWNVAVALKYFSASTQELKTYLAALPQHGKILLGLSSAMSHSTSCITDQIFIGVTTGN